MPYFIRKSLLALSILFSLTLTQPTIAGPDPFIGEIDWVPYNFAPRGWAFCDGQLLSIPQNSALFSLIGTIYGGDGRTNFALPDMRGRMPLHVGSGPGLTPRTLGEKSGEESVTLSVNQMPNHIHSARGSSSDATSVSPAGNVWGSKRRTRLYSPDPANVDMDASAIAATGGGQAHNNMPPYLVLHCIIALQGIFPSRN
jgi:microcystin-dependent protein